MVRSMRGPRPGTTSPGLGEQREEAVARESERREHERAKERLAIDIGPGDHRSASSDTDGGASASPPAKRSSACRCVRSWLMSSSRSPSMMRSSL